jgi:hypothetical protein
MGRDLGGRVSGGVGKSGEGGKAGWGCRERLAEERLPGETTVPLATLRVEDPQFGTSPRRAEPVARDGHLRPLAHHVAAEPDPRLPGELEMETRGFGHRTGQIGGLAGRSEDHEQRAGPPCQGRQSMDTIGGAGDTAVPRSDGATLRPRSGGVP